MFKNFFQNLLFQKDKTQAAAKQLGFSISEQTRNVQLFGRYGNPLEVEKYQVIKYSYASDIVLQDFKLLQRELVQYHNKLPSGWKLEANEISDKLLDAIIYITNDWTDELLEIEVNGRIIEFYWEEWGGIKIAKLLHKYASLIKEANS